MIVYYGIADNLPVAEPVEAYKYALKHDSHISKVANADYNASQMFRCPAIKASFTNTFAVLSPFDYSITVADGVASSSDYNQNFYDNNVVFRDADSRLLSYTAPKLYLFAEKSLVAEQLPPFFGEMVNDANYIVGKYDIGKHFRGLELALTLRKNTSVDIKQDKPLYYVRFDTNEAIKFKRFFFTDELLSLSNQVLNIRNSRRPRPLDYYYNIVESYGYRKRFLKLITQNLAG
jgi:hypothetical protein